MGGRGGGLLSSRAIPVLHHPWLGHWALLRPVLTPRPWQQALSVCGCNVAGEATQSTGTHGMAGSGGIEMGEAGRLPCVSTGGCLRRVQVLLDCGAHPLLPKLHQIPRSLGCKVERMPRMCMYGRQRT